ncbi:MAG TPA: DNA repair protein RecO [Gammaproteobacteria bacterium]|nr:DNA repair protein RecO [Gammaproteobacteria bacterium]
MKAERVALTQGYVLHQRAWRETSRIVEVWTREHGRLGLVARGVRRPKSPFRSLLQPFTPLLLSWSQRGELGNLTGLEAAAAPVSLQGRALMAGFYMNELLLRLLPRQDAHPGLYDWYTATLAKLSGSRQPAPALRIFEKHLLSAVGYGLILTHAGADGAPVKPESSYRYDLDSGPQPVTAKLAAGMLISGRALLALHHEALDDAEDLKAVKRLLRTALERHLDGKALKTSGVMRAMARTT